ncbi:serine/threonine-protein kinase haspin [Nematocida sp. AWRm80]|nr:serine/threonine-protein kinase haspin [Nematocida sp. AWRm80]
MKTFKRKRYSISTAEIILNRIAVTRHKNSIPYGINTSRTENTFNITSDNRSIPEKNREEERNKRNIIDNKYSKVEYLKYNTFGILPITSKKIAESTYCDIFREQNRIFKIVPLRINKSYKKVEHMEISAFLKECLVMKRMNICKYTSKIHKYTIVNDRYTPQMIKECKRYREENIFYNQIPQKNNSSGLFGVIEMEYSGIELSKLDFTSITEKSIQSIKDSLRMAIKYLDLLNIEHRDLHESNVLVLEDTVRIIDYSLSRIEYTNEEKGLNITINKDSIEYSVGGTLYTDLDIELAEILNSNDSTIDTDHRRIYIQMSKECPERVDRWKYHLKSNSLWLNYLLDWIDQKKNNRFSSLSQGTKE